MLFFGVFLLLTGSGSILLGILFIIASEQNHSRLITGLVLIGAGVLLFIPGFRLFKRSIQKTPVFLRKRILKLARRYNGELNEEIINTEIGSSGSIDAILQPLIENGSVKIKKIENRDTYVFKDFKYKLLQKTCPYCGNDYPARDMTITCPGCGGNLKFATSVRSGNTLYSMDEEE